MYWIFTVVVTPQRTTNVRAKEGQLELFCTEIDESWLVQRVSELLVDMHMHEDDSRSLTMRSWLRHDCPELEIHTMGVCD